MSTEFFIDEAGQHRFRVQAGNGEILTTSEGYTTKQSAERGLLALAMELAPIAPDGLLIAWAEGHAEARNHTYGIACVGNPYMSGPEVDRG